MMTMDRSPMAPMMTDLSAAMRPASNMNMAMMPRCTMNMEKCEGGLKMTCVCEDATSAAMLQNLCNMMSGGMISYNVMMNGMVMMTCNMTMGMCKCEMTKNGMTMTCTSGDADCCKMIQACCDAMTTMMKAGCMCCMCMNGTPICCGC